MEDDLLIANVLLSQSRGEIYGWGDKRKNKMYNIKIKDMKRQIVTRWITRIVWIVIIGYFLQTEGGMILGFAVVLFLVYYLIRMAIAIACMVVTFFFIILILGLIIF